MVYTHYDYLELPPGASTARIEAAYEMIKQRLRGNSDESLVRLIHEAYAVLSDPKRRNAYDDELQRAAEEADAELRAHLDRQPVTTPREVADAPEGLVAEIDAWAA